MNDSPPFSATPLGQPLNPRLPLSNRGLATPPSKQSPLGGFPGFTRSQGQKRHAGFDDAPLGPVDDAENVVARWRGTGIGLVLRADERKEKKNGPGIGMCLTIIFTDGNDTWISNTLHHKRLLVQVGNIVRPGQEIAIGAGGGSIFESSRAGAPHVHWELYKNLIQVHPLTGETLPFPKKERGEARRTRRAEPPGRPDTHDATADRRRRSDDSAPNPPAAPEPREPIDDGPPDNMGTLG